MLFQQFLNGFILGSIYALNAAMNCGVLEPITPIGEVCLIGACLSNVAPARHKRSSVKH